ncbi:MAG: GNAT family N-acetyltransferase [Acidimicrobiales bacterium]
MPPEGDRGAPPPPPPPAHGPVELRPARFDDVLLAPLRRGLAQEYEARYGPGDEMATTTDADFVPPGGLFLVVVHQGAVISGGGYRRVTPEVCEVKRMWTRADHRRHGHATVVLRALEDAAAAAGYATVRLETGDAQPEAAALYTSSGYRRIPVYGRYPDALAFERRVGGATDRRGGSPPVSAAGPGA